MMEATASLLFSLRKRTSGNEEDEAQRENAMVVVVIVRFLRVDAWSFVYTGARASQKVIDQKTEFFPKRQL
jgi:hypothetical protein